MSNLSWLSCIAGWHVSAVVHMFSQVCSSYVFLVASGISVDHQVKHQFVSVRLWPKMTSIVDSEAHLAKKATEVGLTDGALQSLVRSSWPTWDTD